MLSLQQALLEAATVPREEVASSRLSLEEETDKFYFEEGETQWENVVHISDAEEETDRNSGVHAPILVIAHPDNTSEEKKEEVAFNWGNRSLRDLMAMRNRGTTSQEVPKSQVPPTLLPSPPLLPTSLRLKAIPDLKKKRPIQDLEEGEVGL